MLDIAPEDNDAEAPVEKKKQPEESKKQTKRGGAIKPGLRLQIESSDDEQEKEERKLAEFEASQQTYALGPAAAGSTSQGSAS